MAQTFTRDQVAQTSSRDAETLLTIIDSRVYDLSDFIDAHPGGETVLKQVAGKDATSEFYNLHRHEVLVKYSDLCVGTIDGETGQVVERKPGDLSVVPYGEPTWLTPMYHSPYFGESHKRLRKAMREFMEVHVQPEAREREESGETISDELIAQMAEKNVLAMRMGPGKHLYGRKLLDGAVEPEEFDCFHDLIVAQETGWISARGFMDGNMAGMTISLSVILKYCNSEALKKRITEECLSGKKKICLAVTEAFAGSDVAGMKTEVRKDKDGSYYISGTKKWITNGVFCDYFITAAKTPKGMSVFLVERGPGLETQLIRTSYSAAAGTAFVTYDNVKVPAENLLGEEDKGFAVVMNNFNHERWFMSCAVIRQMRVVTEECLKWSNQRMVFGKKLIEQPVIRGK
jgi:alkylation response protein AidB-like acyl-CoA dehydrogenase/predicted heme/steroid binding protein